MEELQKRNLPELLTPDGKWTPQRREEALGLLTQNVFGIRPPDPVKMEFKESGLGECEFDETHDPATLDWFKNSGKAEFKRVRTVCHLSGEDFPGLKNWPGADGKFEFDISCYLPRLEEGKKVPAVVAVHYRESFDVHFLPMREIVGQGVAVFAFRYRHIVNDYPAGDHPRFDGAGLDRLYFGDYRLRDNPAARKPREPGTIQFWSWAASRAMDYVQTQGARIDLARVAVAGHSRLGKTALLTAATDTRFSHVLSNASCAAGAALSRGDRKEDLRTMSGWPAQWFCENLKTEHSSPLFDMHFMLACVAPRKICVSNSDQDHCCDEISEYLSCVAASPAWQCLGKKGFVHPGRLPVAGDKFHGGDIGYHLRPGAHDFLLEDWMPLLEFFLNPNSA